MKILYFDNDIIVCIKPSGVLSTDESGGMPDIIKKQLKLSNLDIKTVHRLDRITAGLMVYALGSDNAANLGRQITNKTFIKKYLVVVHGKPNEDCGLMNDLLFRDTSKNMTYPVKRMRKGVRDASLKYNILQSKNEMSIIEVELYTGRTHQIRVQFSSRKMPVLGDNKYGASKDNCQLALWSYYLSFNHPVTGKLMTFTEYPPDIFPWSEFDGISVIRPQDEYEIPERKAFRESAFQKTED